MTLPDINDAKKAYRVAAKLRDKRKHGKELTPEQAEWLKNYEAAHPSARVKPPAHTEGGAASFMASSAAEGGRKSEGSDGGSPAGTSAAPQATSFPTGAATTPPPIDLSGAPAGAAPGAPGAAGSPAGAPTQAQQAHEQQCEEMAKQFVAVLYMVGEKIKDAGGVPLSEFTLNNMVGPSAKRLLLRYLPQGGETNHYLDIGVVGGSVAYMGYQGVLVTRRKRELERQEAIKPLITPQAAPAVPPKDAPPKHVPSDTGPMMPQHRIDPAQIAEDELTRPPAKSTGRGDLVA